MISLEDITKYLPKYLSGSAQEELFDELKRFPDNIDQRLYTASLKEAPNIFQGDGIKDLLFVNLPAREINPAPGIIISNTCDIDPGHKRLMPMRMAYAPIFNLKKYKQALYKDHVQTGSRSEESLESHINEITKQRISHIFYLPKTEGLENDSLVFFDRLNNCPSDYLQGEQIQNKRIFILSDYGYYLFLFKLSVHFTRIREGISRSSCKENSVVMEDYADYGYLEENQG
jgi:hypothetical protein